MDIFVLKRNLFDFIDKMIKSSQSRMKMENKSLRLFAGINTSHSMYDFFY